MARTPPDDEPPAAPGPQDESAQLGMPFLADAASAPKPRLPAEPRARSPRIQPAPVSEPLALRPPPARKPARPGPVTTREHELASPVDISDMPIDRGDTLRWASVTIMTAAIALLFANAGTLSAWIDEKDPTPLQQRASALATAWTGAMDAIGVTTPRRKLHEKWKTLQAARFGEEAPGAAQ